MKRLIPFVAVLFVLAVGANVLVYRQRQRAIWEAEQARIMSLEREVSRLRAQTESLPTHAHRQSTARDQIGILQDGAGNARFVVRDPDPVLRRLQVPPPGYTLRGLGEPGQSPTDRFLRSGTPLPR